MPLKNNNITEIIDLYEKNNTELADFLHKIVEKIDYKKHTIDLNQYREKLSPFVVNNNDVLVLNSANLFIYWSEKKIDKNKLYSMTLYDYLEYKWVKWYNTIYLYRWWKIIKARKLWNTYIDEKNKQVHIFFWDIIAFDKLVLKQNVLDMSVIKKKIWFFRVKDILKVNNKILIKFNTLLWKNKAYKLVYDMNTWEIQVESDKIKNNIEFYNRFIKIFKYFEWVNMFDEPVNEKNGEQLDWSLRPLAIQALQSKQKEFEFRWIKYNLFKSWRINIPQVCVDFVLDFYEKLADSYYNVDGVHPDKLFFDKIIWKWDRRRILEIIEYIKKNKNIAKNFLIHNVDKIYSYSEWEKLYLDIRNTLSKKIKVWDILVIWWFLKDKEYHYHSVVVSDITINWNIFVYENPKYPTKNNLIKVLSRWPRRKIKYILRPTDNLRKLIYK